MSAKVVLEFEVADGKADDVIAFFRKVLPDTRSYAGFESLTVHRDQDDPNKFLVWEQWASRQEYEKYLSWRTESGALGELVAMLAGEPKIRFFDHVGA